MKGALGLQTIGLTPDLALSLISCGISGCHLGAQFPHQRVGAMILRSQGDMRVSGDNHIKCPAYHKN